MTEWGVVGVIIAIVGLVAAVVKPMLTLNTSIVQLTERLAHLSEGLAELTTRNTENHKRIWKSVEEHSGTLADHEKRIDHLENGRGTQ